MHGVIAGHFYTMLVKNDGSVWATGSNEFGQLGDGSRNAVEHFERVIESDAYAVAAGHMHSMILKMDGSLWAAGYNEFGLLGDASISSTNLFVNIVVGEDRVNTGAWL